MAGRFSSWHHKKPGGVQISGDDMAAGRKVLGALAAQLKMGGVESGNRSVVLPSGSVATANIAMGMPTLSIRPQAGRRRFIPARALGEIITAPRSEALPDGLHPEHPEVMLRVSEEFAFWKSYFYGNPPDGLSVQSGVYVDMFPQGLGRGGNADWLGPDGERLSWHGPSSRMFVDAYVNATKQSGKKVFYLGEELLDTDEYLGKSVDDPGFTDKYIVGAALKLIDGTYWLYTMQYPGEDTVTEAPPIGSTLLTGYFSYPLPEQVATGGLHRYRLYKRLDEQGVVRLEVAANSREFLVATGTGGPDPWFFNQDCTEVVCHPALTPYAAPGKPWWAARVEHRDNPPDADDDTSGDPEPHPPGYAALRFRITITDVGVSGEAVAFGVTSGGPAQPVTADYDSVTGALFGYGIRFSADLVPYFVFDGLEAVLYESRRTVGAGTAGEDIIDGVKRSVIYASPRDHVVVFMRMDVQFDKGLGVGSQLVLHTQTLELFIDGELVSETVVAATPEESLFGVASWWADSGELLDGLDGISISPQYFIYGLLLILENTYDPPGPPAPGDEFTFRSVANYLGCNAMYAQWPYPTDCWYGYSDPNIAIGEPAQPVSALATPGFNGAAADEYGFFSVTGCARHEDVVALSCWVPKVGMDDSFYYLTGETLPGVTGVGGPQARYHPIRILGKMPVEDREVQDDA